MNPLNCKHITKAVVQIDGHTITAYSHFGHLQACKNAVWKAKKLYGGRK